MFTAANFVDFAYPEIKKVSIGAGANRGGEEVEGQDVLRGS